MSDQQRTIIAKNDVLLHFAPRKDYSFLGVDATESVESLDSIASRAPEIDASLLVCFLADVELRRHVLLTRTSDESGALAAFWSGRLLSRLDNLELRFGNDLVFGTERWEVKSAPPPDGMYSVVLSRGRNAASSPFERAIWLCALTAAGAVWRKSPSKFGVPRFDVVTGECIDRVVEAAADLVARRLLVSEHWTMLAANCLRRALALGTSIRAESKYERVLDAVATTAALLVDEDPIWATSLLHAELTAREKFDRWDADRSTQVDGLADRLDEKFAAWIGRTREREHVLELRVQAARLSGRAWTEQEIARERARHLEHTASQFKGAPIMAGPALDDAAVQWQRAGDRARADAAIEASRGLMRRAAQQAGRISVSTEIPAEVAVMSLAATMAGADGTTDELWLAGGRLFLPWFEAPAGRGAPPEGITSILASQAVVGDRLQEAEVPDGSGWRPSQVQHRIRTELALATDWFLLPLMRRWRSDSKLDEAFLGLWCGTPAGALRDVGLMARVAEALAAGDWVEFLHLLPPRLEQLLDLTLATRGGSGVKREPEGLQMKTLSVLLDSAVASGMATEVGEYLAAVLTRDWGPNIRNVVAHGYADEAWFTEARAAQLLHASLVLMHWSLRNSDDDTGSSADASKAAP